MLVGACDVPARPLTSSGPPIALQPAASSGSAASTSAPPSASPSASAGASPTPSTGTSPGASPTLSDPSPSPGTPEAALEALIPAELLGQPVYRQTFSGEVAAQSAGNDACLFVCTQGFVDYAEALGVPVESITVSTAYAQRDEAFVLILGIRTADAPKGRIDAWRELTVLDDRLFDVRELDLDGRPVTLIEEIGYQQFPAAPSVVTYLREQGDDLWVVYGLPLPDDPGRPTGLHLAALDALP